MNRTTQYLTLLLLCVVSCLSVAAALVLLELRTGKEVFSYMVATYVPAGAIGAGLAAAAIFYLGALALRLRPPSFLPVAMLLLAAASVFLLDSLHYGLMAIDRNAVTSPASFERLFAYSLAHSPLRFDRAGGGADDSVGAAPGTSASLSSVAGESDSRVQGLGAGVQGMLSSGNALSADNVGASFAGAKRSLAGIQALGSGAVSSAAVLELAGLQLVGFALGGLLAFRSLRTFSYCDSCDVFLRKKGEQTRYYDREREIQTCVHEFLTMAKSRRYRQSIEAHAVEGTPEKRKTSEFASTVEISTCKGCNRNLLKFTARRKAGMNWKDISMLAYSAFSVEPIDVAPVHPMPARIR